MLIDELLDLLVASAASGARLTAIANFVDSARAVSHGITDLSISHNLAETYEHDR
jgi:hypothetical protein